MNTTKNEMTDEELRVKVAELAGWLQPNHAPGLIWMPDKDRPGRMKEVDPLADLNAMHEIEKTLSEDDAHEYKNNLSLLKEEPEYPAACYWFHATAHQRCIAFVKTMEAK